MATGTAKRVSSTAPYSDEDCPRCLAKSPCVDWSEVDIGVGTQTWNPEFQCPMHGRFAWVERTIEQIRAGEPPRAIFQDDQLGEPFVGSIEPWRCPSCKTLAISPPSSGRCAICDATV